jgi:hypothetical protein
MRRGAEFQTRDAALFPVAFSGDARVLARRHRLLRLPLSKFPVSDSDPGRHMWPGREVR